MRRRLGVWSLIGVLAVVVAGTRGRDLAGVVLVNLGLAEYVRAAARTPTPADWQPEDLLLARFDRAARVSAAIKRQPQYQILTSLRRGEPPTMSSACAGQPHPWLLIAVLNRARWLSGASDPAGAGQLYAWADRTCPDSFDVLVEWARLKKIEGDHRRRAALLTRAVLLTPTIAPSDHIDKAETWWRSFLLTSVYADLGDSYLALDDPHAAVRWLEQAQRLSPQRNIPWTLQLLGIAYYRAGRIAEAKQTFLAALAQLPDLPDARSYLQKIDSGAR